MNKPPIRPFEIDPTTDPKIELAEPSVRDIDPADTDIIEPETAATRGWRRWLWPSLGIGITGLLALQTYIYVTALLVAQPILGILFTIFLSLFAAAVFGFVWREWADLRRIRQRASIREEAHRLAKSELHGDAQGLLSQLDTHLSTTPEARKMVALYHQRATDTLSDGEALALYERTVIGPLDKRAYRLAMESSRDVGLLTALSPLGLLDGLLVLWRTTIMIRQIAKLYGLTLGPTATFKLLRNSVRNAAIAGVADMVSHAALEHVGASITALLSARAGQGAGNALLSARLSLEVIRQSRPLPYLTLEPPRLKQIRDAIFADKETAQKLQRR